MDTINALSSLQKKQAALLYHFTSLDYLKNIHQRLTEIMVAIDGSLDVAAADGRDAVLMSKQWGARNTSKNWGNNAWQFLVDFQHSLSHNLSNRAFDIYAVTGMNQCARGMSEFSMLWLEPDKQDAFDKKFAELSQFCQYLNYTADRAQPDGIWDDFDFTIVWNEQKNEFPRLPKMQLRLDITCSDGMKPPRTGVYFPINDPHGAAQFGWTGNDDGKLLQAKTFNELGLDALDHVGRDRLWLDDQAMYQFARLDRHKGRFDPRMKVADTFHPALASSAVAREAFVAVPRDWCYVELIDGEFEDIDDTPSPLPIRPYARVEGGGTCIRSGFYFTPVNDTSRRFFNAGEHMPDLGSPVGRTIWQWDPCQ